MPIVRYCDYTVGLYVVGGFGDGAVEYGELGYSICSGTASLLTLTVALDIPASS